ncbi:MAG: hypothetical protein V1754_14675 [Pseudomonadota bacterium]
MKKKLVQSLGVILATVLIFGCDNLKPIKARKGGATAGAGDYQGPKVKVELYVMSKCPYGVQALQGFKPVMDEIGPYVDLVVEYIAYKKEGKWAPMHGEPEHQGNILHLCATKHFPDKASDFIDCLNKAWGNLPKGWETCASSIGLDQSKMKSCFEGKEGEELANASYERSQKRGASGSPTIFIAGERYSGDRSKNELLRAICPNMKGPKPPACAKIPEPVEVNAIIVTDKRCKECDTNRMVESLRGRFFPKLTVKTLDYGDQEGKKFYDELGIKLLPLMVFEPGVEKSEHYARLQRWMIPKGKYQQLRIPASFDPTAEICDNKTDDTGNGKVDCADPSCKGTLVCRPEILKKLDVFIMSQCPYGVKAIDAMKEVLPNFKGQMKFDVHYIAEKEGDGFKSLHGQPEVDENIRQLCAKKYYGKNDKYLDYMWCRNKDYRNNEWKGCATNGIKAEVIEKCATGADGKKLLEEDIKIGQALQVSGSPTWLANNRHKFSGIAPEPIKQSFCEHNKDLKNCDKKLTDNAGAPAGKCN